MIKLFRAVESEYQRALDKLGGNLADMRNFNRLLNRFSMKTSARNQFAGQIVGLREGAIIEQGSHEELMTARGFYYDLYASQFEEALDEAS